MSWRQAHRITLPFPLPWVKWRNKDWKFSKKSPNPDNEARFWFWQLKSELFHEKIGDIFKMYLRQISLVYSAHHATSNLGALLRWHQEFARKYQNFSLWGFRIKVKLIGQNIYSYLKQTDYLRLVAGIKEITDRMNQFWMHDREGSKAILAAAQVRQ